MKLLTGILWVCSAALLITVSGCGQKKAESAGQSFGSAVTVPVTSPSASSAVSPQESQKASPAAGHNDAAAAPTPSASPAAETSAAKASVDAKPSEAPTAKSAEKPQAAASSMPAEGVTVKKVDAAALPSAEPKQAEALPSAKPKAERSSKEINWLQFFDDDKQDRPSEDFWNKSGQSVQIKGFMGEVLSFDKHWFLLIPKPGAECPFDNGDETYWNKIMIVFVPDDVKLRYTSGPLMITGKLDVGVKLDESGYKTMFRLYDATFEKIKE
ncbi:hypothetical protein GK047_03970 [Paenibacillus sp. SYP-B3998]|uniref:Uncharacterized protein n=1 Tax=Paenibacillus sp. SYP-B3998 TaxID=2678564 RepID=A0A6G3ZUT3_9BACL|nr:hypothetical protein [Paenibacillus sp. SYP-B3998]NEW05177.1 hypothetical protein [Paenibacillus sp. SYP-B3998]